MNQTNFNAVTQALTRVPSRRNVLRGLAGVGLSIGALRSTEAVARNTKKGKRKDKRKQKTAFNQYGCLDIGQSCKGASAHCCSGICEGKKPKKGKKDTSTCVGHHDAGFCAADTDTCTVGQGVHCNASNPSCACALTTGNAGFCGDFSGSATVVCRVCSHDTDCQAELGPGAACVVLKGICSGVCPATGSTACMAPCA